MPSWTQVVLVLVFDVGIVEIVFGLGLCLGLGLIQVLAVVLVLLLSCFYPDLFIVSNRLFGLPPGSYGSSDFLF